MLKQESPVKTYITKLMESAIFPKVDEDLYIKIDRNNIKCQISKQNRKLK